MPCIIFLNLSVNVHDSQSMSNGYQFSFVSIYFYCFTHLFFHYITWSALYILLVFMILLLKQIPRCVLYIFLVFVILLFVSLTKLSRLFIIIFFICLCLSFFIHYVVFYFFLLFLEFLNVHCSDIELLWAFLCILSPMIPMILFWLLCPMLSVLLFVICTFHMPPCLFIFLNAFTTAFLFFISLFFGS